MRVVPGAVSPHMRRWHWAQVMRERRGYSKRGHRRGRSAAGQRLTAGTAGLVEGGGGELPDGGGQGHVAEAGGVVLPGTGEPAEEADQGLAGGLAGLTG